LFVFACLATALFGRFVYLVRPFDHDAAMFVYLGKSVCDGQRFCHDVIDNKFPSVGLFTSIFWRAFGTYWPGYVIAQALMCAAAVGLLARSAARNIGERARWPTALAAMVYLNFTVAVFGGFQLETMQVFFAVIAACSAMDALRSGSKWDAAMLKPTGLAPMGAFALVLMHRFAKRPGRAGAGLAAMTLLGLSIPVAVVIAYLVSIDILRDMPAVVMQISLYAASTPLHWTDVFKPITVLTLAGFAIVVRGWVFRRHVDQRVVPLERDIIGFAVAWFVLELLGGLMQRRMYGYHFLPIGAPAALLFGMIPRRDRAHTLAAALAPVMILSVLGAREVLNYPDPRLPILPTSEYLLTHAGPDDEVWQDAMPRLLLETNLKPGARFPIMFLFGNYDSAALDYTPMLLRDFEQRKPRYIILPSDVEQKIESEVTYCGHLVRSPVRAANFAWAWRRIERHVKANYQPLVQIRAETIYRRVPATSSEVSPAPSERHR
jgi:hypothetical protein